MLFKACKTDKESENITNLSVYVQLFTKSRAKSIALASAMKTEEPSGIRIFLQSSYFAAAHPTFSSSLDPAV